MLERDSAAVGRAAAARGLLARRAGAGGGRAPPCARTRRARRPRPQRQPDARLARAGRGPRGGRAGRAAPAQLPARLRGRHVLQRPRRGLHALPRPRHAARRAAELPRRRARRGGRLRRGARALAAAARRARPTRSSSRARSRSRGCATLGAPLGDAPSTSCPPVQRAFAPRSARRATGEYALVAGAPGAARRASTSRSTPCARAGLPLVVAGDGPEAAALRARAGADVRFVGPCAAGRARRAARARRAGDRAVALRRDLRRSPRSRRWRRACRWSRRAIGRAARARRRPGGARAARRLDRARRRRARARTATPPRARPGCGGCGS